MSSLDRSILRLLHRRGETHVRDISSALDAHPVTIDQRCFSLHRSAYIRSLGTGVYQLTEEGLRSLDVPDHEPGDGSASDSPTVRDP